MKEVLKILEEGTKGEKRALLSFSTEGPEEIRKKFNIWSRWYFPRFFPSPDAPFHKDMDLGLIGVYLGKESSFLNIAHRDSAKTTRAKLFVAYCIANDELRRRKYIKVLSKDGDNSRQFVTDLYNLLISPRIKELYPEIFQKTETKREERMSVFTTSTDIKVASDTVGTDQRGDIQDESRPDFIIHDDIETRKSLMSAVVTQSIWLNMEEARTGLAKNGGSIYLCNYISERGNVHKLVQKIENKLIVPIEENGEPTWPERFSKEDIASIKKQAEDYEGEYLCKPSAGKDVYFDRDSVDKQVSRQPIEEIAGLKIFRKYDPSNRTAGGMDIGGGVGLDSSTSVYMDFDCYPIQVLATYKNNEIKPEAFGHEIARQGKRFGECLVAPENNKFDSVITILKQTYPLHAIHQSQKAGPRIINQVPTEYGWQTNGATKPMMLSEFSQAIERGIIELNDPDLIAEARSYTAGDLMDREVDPRLTTRHFDLLIAACIAYQMNKYVRKPEKPDPVSYIQLTKMSPYTKETNEAR